jgi:hypothetical protein
LRRGQIQAFKQLNEKTIQVNPTKSKQKNIKAKTDLKARALNREKANEVRTAPALNLR